MKSIGLVANLINDPRGVKTASLVKRVINTGAEIFIMPEIYDLIGCGTPVKERILFDRADVIVSLGGDGTLLHAARQAALRNKAILGINIGNLGFLTDVEYSHWDKAMESLQKGDYSTETRMMLSGTVIRDGVEHPPFIALNDIGIMKALVSRIIHLRTYINKNEVNEYSGDGLLVSSPTGSTAYSLSAGGPIVNPSLECLILTPICPHSLNARSIITNSNDVIEIEVVSQDRNITLTADGQGEATLYTGDRVQIRKSNTYIKLLRTKEQNFFQLLHDKITI